MNVGEWGEIRECDFKRDMKLLFISGQKVFVFNIKTKPCYCSCGVKKLTLENLLFSTVIDYNCFIKL